MSDPQYQMKVWLAQALEKAGHGSKSKLAKVLGVRPDAITRMTNIDGKEPREIKAHELEIMRTFFSRERDGDRSISLVSSYDPENEPEDDMVGYTREHWKPAIDGALPELDMKLGAGSGVVGETISIGIGAESISGHPVVAEWLIPLEYLRNEAKASPNHTLVMEVIGDSMQSTYMPGDRVLVDLSQNAMSSDTVYAISDGQSEPQIKRLQRVPFSDPVEVRIISDNPNLERFTVELERLTIIGRIVGHIARK